MQQHIETLANGVQGRALVVPSHTPRSFEDAIAGRWGPAVDLQATLYVPAVSVADAGRRHAAVIIIPGSGGVLPPMLVHAQALVHIGIAVLLVDAFGGRGVVDTVAEQRQIPFAASACDIFAAMRRLAQEPNLDTTRLGAMGYSRGGVAVLGAAMSVLANASLQGQPPLKAVLAGWPWCGYQFKEPEVGSTAVRMVVADHDDWASAVQSQAYHSVLQARGARASLRLVKNAKHGFGYGSPVQAMPEAMVALNAPIVYFDTDGVLLDPWTGQRRPGADDSAIVQLLLPFVGRGVTLGAQPGQMQDFIADFTAFFRTELLG